MFVVSVWAKRVGSDEKEGECGDCWGEGQDNNVVMISFLLFLLGVVSL